MESNIIRILGLDFETQDADPKTTNPTEVGAALYEVDIAQNTWKKLFGFSHFIYEPHYPPQSQKIIELTGITDEILMSQGKPRKEVFERLLLPLVNQADIVMCHKTAFDWTLFVETCKRVELTPPVKELLCTLTNFPWPGKYTCHKLGHLAWEHGIDVKAADLHRAENDVDLMVQLVASKYKIKDVLAYARSPWVYLKADILGPWAGKGGDGGVQKGIASGLGFSFESVKGTDFPKWPKTWVTRVKSGREMEVINLASASESPFRVSVIEGLS